MPLKRKMSKKDYPDCPHCGSANVLPFEDEEKTKGDATLFIVIVLALALIIGYLLFMISVYLTFPLVVFAAIIVSSKLINRSEGKKKVEKKIERNYMCLDCSSFFRK